MFILSILVKVCKTTKKNLIFKYAGYRFNFKNPGTQRIEKKTWQILTLKITKSHFKGKVYY